MPAPIDAVNSLAFSMCANKGVYAVLLGSGVSRASKIPTGWEITLDLVRKVAVLQGATCEPDPAAWYEATFGKQPDYSELLDVLCKSPAERQQLVRAYLEATDAERENGDKQPSVAHHAIASLVKAGFIRVILTTNFDKLMELALDDIGIVPTVLSSPDHIDGALPLVHTPCTIIKIHGDYLDTRIRNTPSELAEYPDQFKHLLDRVFDEYGMIVCGWSAEWDEAMRNALIRAPYRRFSTYWASRGIPGTAAQDLIHRKAAHIISIEGADSFFAKLRELVTALESFSQPHPLSTDAAVASLKKYLSEPKYRIQLDDLVSVEVDRAIESVAGPAFDVSEHPVDTTTLSNRVRRYEAVSSTLVAMSLVAGYWTTGDQVKPWKRAIVRLAQRKMNGVVSWLDLQRYPACLLTYAFGLGAIASENLAALSTILSASIAHEHREDISVVKALSPLSMFENGTGLMKLLPGKQQHHLPLNSWIEDLFAPISTNFFQNEREYKFAFDRLEFLWSLAYAHMQRQQQGHFWVPVGNYIYRGESVAKNMALIRSSLTDLGEKSPYVTSSIFGATVKECEEILEKIDSFMRTLSRY